MWRYNGARESDEKNFVSHRALFFSKKERKKQTNFFSFFGLALCF